MSLTAVLAGCQSNSSTGNTGTTTTAANSARAGGSASVAILRVEGMSCPLCANNIDKQLLDIRGVEDVVINLGTGEVRVALSPANPPSREDLSRAIERSGFTLSGAQMPANPTGGNP